MIVITDTREQSPFDFSRFAGVTVERGTLATGDYSLAGFESVIACERKELNDLIACLQGGNRERFEKELARGVALQHFWVLVEASLEDISRHRYTSQMEPKAALQSIFAFHVRYRTSFLYCGSRGGAEYACYSLLSKFLSEVQKSFNEAIRSGHELKALRKATG
jgi:DNA excision repair protein ERCC-4